MDDFETVVDIDDPYALLALTNVEVESSSDEEEFKAPEPKSFFGKPKIFSLLGKRPANKPIAEQLALKPS